MPSALNFVRCPSEQWQQIAVVVHMLNYTGVPYRLQFSGRWRVKCKLYTLHLSQNFTVKSGAFSIRTRTEHCRFTWLLWQFSVFHGWIWCVLREITYLYQIPGGITTGSLNSMFYACRGAIVPERWTRSLATLGCWECALRRHLSSLFQRQTRAKHWSFSSIFHK